MRRIYQLFMMVLVLAPLTLGAESVRWVPSSTWQDGTSVSAADLAKFSYYLRIWRDGAADNVYYLGETRNGITTWTDNVQVRGSARMNTTLKPGDIVWIDVSGAYRSAVDNVERDSWPSKKGTPVRYVIPAPAVVPPPIPGCNPPTNVTITAQ